MKIQINFKDLLVLLKESPQYKDFFHQEPLNNEIVLRPGVTIEIKDYTCRGYLRYPSLNKSKELNSPSVSILFWTYLDTSNKACKETYGHYQTLKEERIDLSYHFRCAFLDKAFAPRVSTRKDSLK